MQPKHEEVRNQKVQFRRIQTGSESLNSRKLSLFPLQIIHYKMEKHTQETSQYESDEQN